MRIALIGVGLIGGSFALALRAAKRADSIVGFDADATASAAALARAVIDRSAPSIADAVQDADLIVIATPVGAFESVLRGASSAFQPTAIVTDVGSTKADIIDSARVVLGSRIGRFVPGHPIAGGERNGVEFAKPELFRGRLFISTPTKETDADAVGAVEALWSAVGARIERMEASEHDRVFAAVSHVPHLLAFALVAQIAAQRDADRKFAHAGGGFRDFTRIAAASPAMWRDICLTNGPAIVEQLSQYGDGIRQLIEAVENRDSATLDRLFGIASQARRRYAATLDGPELGRAD